MYVAIKAFLHYFSYKWEKNGEPLLITGADYKKVPGEGTIIIEEPMADHEGVYQCFASNAHGTAVSKKTILRKACKYFVEKTILTSF